MRSTGAEFAALPEEADYDDSDMNVAFPGRVGKSGVAGIRWDVSNICLKPAPAQIRAVDEAIKQEQVDAILIESMFIGALGLLARPRAERPAIVNLGTNSLGVESIDTAPYGLGILPKPGMLGRIRNAALGVLTKKIIFGGVQRQAEKIMVDATGKKLDGFFMEDESRADAIVQFTVPSFEYDRSDLPDTVHFLGPMSRVTKSDGSCPSSAPSLTVLAQWCT